MRVMVLLLAAAIGAGAAAQEPAAVVDGQPITMAEVESEAQARLVTVRQQEYQIKAEALGELIFKRLQAAEAAKAGVTLEELYRVNVLEKVTPPSEEDVKQVLERYRAQLPGSDEEARARVVEFLRAQRQREREQAYRAELLARHEVRTLLEPPRVTVAVAPGDPVRGPAAAPVTVVEFSDFECPYCRRVKPTLAQLRDQYGDKVRWVFKQFPLPMHPNAQFAAEAALCAGDQGKFWAMHDWLFANQGGLNRDALMAAAPNLQLEVPALGACLDAKKHAATVARDMEAAQAAGISGTPAFVVNGRLLSGAQPVEAFREAIDDELRRAGIAPPPPPTPAPSPAPTAAPAPTPAG